MYVALSWPSQAQFNSNPYQSIDRITVNSPSTMRCDQAASSLINFCLSTQGMHRLPNSASFEQSSLRLEYSERRKNNINHSFFLWSNRSITNTYHKRCNTEYINYETHTRGEPAVWYTYVSNICSQLMLDLNSILPENCSGWSKLLLIVTQRAL